MEGACAWCFGPHCYEDCPMLTPPVHLVKKQVWLDDNQNRTAEAQNYSIPPVGTTDLLDLDALTNLGVQMAEWIKEFELLGLSSSPRLEAQRVKLMDTYKKMKLQLLKDMMEREAQKLNMPISGSKMKNLNRFDELSYEEHFCEQYPLCTEPIHYTEDSKEQMPDEELTRSQHEEPEQLQESEPQRGITRGPPRELEEDEFKEEKSGCQKQQASTHKLKYLPRAEGAESSPEENELKSEERQLVLVEVKKQTTKNESVELWNFSQIQKPALPFALFDMFVQEIVVIKPKLKNEGILTMKVQRSNQEKQKAKQNVETDEVQQFFSVKAGAEKFKSHVRGPHQLKLRSHPEPWKQIFIEWPWDCRLMLLMDKPQEAIF